MNLLTAMTVHAQIDPNWTPVPKLVEIGNDEVYKVGKKGQDDIVSLTGNALDKLARAAGVEHVKTLFNHNVAQGDGGGFECMVTSRVRGPDGLWIYSTKSVVRAGARLGRGGRAGDVLVDRVGRSDGLLLWPLMWPSESPFHFH